MNRVHMIIDRCLQVFIGLSMCLLVFITFGQVVGRYLFGYSFAWAEDLCILIFCWSVWTTACLLLRDNRHLRVTALIVRLPFQARHWISLFTGIIILVFLGLVFYASFGVLGAMAGMDYITLPLPINVKYVSVPVGVALMFYYLIRTLFSFSKEESDGDY